MTPPVCYLERSGAGNILRRVRLVGDRLDASWTAPELAPSTGGEESGGDAGADPAVILQHARAAARWVADTLPRGVKGLGRVCLDTDGGLCVWLSAPSPDPAVVAAAMTQGNAFASADGSPDSGAGNLLALASAGAGMERSVQALARGGAGRSGRSISRPAGEDGALPDAHALRRRMAVLSVPDLPARIFLDELDALGVECAGVCSLWHAMAAVWDPALSSAGSFENRVATNLAQTTAVLLLDPASGAGAGGEGGSGGASGVAGGGGRLLWSWSAGGELLAAGSMRLRASAPSAPAPATPAANGDGARRIYPADHDSAERTVLCGRAEAGRLVADWLAWGAQLGQTPARIVCVGPMPAAPIGEPGLLECLAETWQNASIDAAACPDPVGLTLAKVGDPAAAASPDAPADDPLLGLCDLTRRPGRDHRRMYQWAAASLAAGAVVIAALGWRAGALTRSTLQQADLVNTELAAALVSVRDLVGSDLSTSVDPLGDLQAALNRYNAQRSAVDREPPVLAELANIFLAMEEEENVRLEEVSVGPLSAIVRLSTGAPETGPAITTRLQGLSKSMTWSGSDDRGTLSAAPAGMRSWSILGSWRQAGSRPGAAGRPGTGGRP